MRKIKDKRKINRMNKIIIKIKIMIGKMQLYWLFRKNILILIYIIIIIEIIKIKRNTKVK